MTNDQEKIIAAAKAAGAYRYINRAAKDEPTHTFTIEQLERFWEIAIKSVDTPIALAEAYRCGEEAGRAAEQADCVRMCTIRAKEQGND